MEQLTLFDEKVSEYLVVIPPSEKVSEDVKGLKKTFYDLIQSNSGNRYAKAHITLLNMYNSSYSDREIISKMQKALSGIRKISISINGVEQFNHGKQKCSFVLSISNPDPICEIYQKIAHEFYLKKARITPHITVAKEVSREEANLLENVITNVSYTHEFEADRISILKREIVDGKAKSYALISDILLQ